MNSKDIKDDFFEKESIYGSKDYLPEIDLLQSNSNSM
jgi:hypothetical protein